MVPVPEDKIRVVHLINHLGRGGTERQLVLLLRHFDRERYVHKVVVFNPSAHRVWDNELAALGVEVITIPAECRGVPRRLLYLARRLRAFRPHVVHSWTVHDNPYAGLVGRWLGSSVRWGSLRGSLHSPALEAMPGWLRSLLLHSVDRVVANCEALKTELCGAGYSARRVLVLPNCVETAATVTPGDLSDLGIGADELLVGVVGNLRRIKNHELFVRAMVEVLPRHPRARAVIVGQPLASEPEYQREIEDLIAQHGLAERLVVTGFRDDVPGILERLAVVCLTSHSEGMPNAVLEAMAAGRPVVAVRVGGVPELVRDGWNGYVVEPDEPTAFAGAVDRLLGNPEHAAELGRNGRQLAMSRHGCRAAAERLAEFYEDALWVDPG